MNSFGHVIARICFVVVISVVVSVAAPVFAQNAKTTRVPVHVEIVLDSSGSMEKNDPARLSVLAAMIFTDLAAPGDHLGVLSMNRGSYDLEAIGPVEGKRASIKRSVRRIRFDGPTDCAGPLRHAAQELERLARSAPDARQFVIFLSDGVCPVTGDAEHNPVRDAAKLHAGNETRIFSIGLFGEEAKKRGDPSRDLRAMADVSGGEYFRARSAADLPRRFSEILGRIVGSQAQDVVAAPNQPARVNLDGYVWDASLIVTGSSAPVIVEKATAPNGTALDVPTGEPPLSRKRSNFYAAAATNGQDQFYEVIQIREPEPGEWTFIFQGPSDAEAILIQNYALDPVVSVEGKQRTFNPGESFRVDAWLKGRDGARIGDSTFLKKVDFNLQIRGPDGKTRDVKMKHASGGRFTCEAELTAEGKHQLLARVSMKKGGLDKASNTVTVETLPLVLRLAEAHDPIDFGEMKAGTSSEAQRLDLSASQVGASYNLKVELEHAEGVDVTPSSAKISPKRRTFEVRAKADAEHPGGVVETELVVRRNGASVRVPARVEVIPLTFWEKWGKIVLTIAIGVGGLLLLLFIVYGILSPFSFPPDARLHWGKSLERLNRNEIVIRDVPGTGRGFYSNAQIVIGGHTSFLSADGVELATLEATGPSRVTLRAAEGATLEKINKFDSDKTKVIEDGETGMHSGEIYRVGDLYIRLQ